MLITEITERGATVSWSPIVSHPNLLACGSLEGSGGGGFDDYGGHLELYSVDFSQPRGTVPTLLAASNTSNRFSSLTWGTPRLSMHEHHMGIIAGGMADGTVNLWSASQLLAATPDPLASTKAHHAAVRALQFNPHDAANHLLATGSSDHKVGVVDLSRVDAPQAALVAPPEAGQHLADVSSLAWNSKVAHILASGSKDGVVIVWDLRNKKPWCRIADPNHSGVAALAWNPDEGLHLLTASDDDRFPVLRLWDLRSSTTTPLVELAGHDKGVLSMAWNPHDTSYLASCGKDNKTLVWDLFTGRAVHEVATAAPGSTDGRNAAGVSVGAGGGGLLGGLGAPAGGPAAASSFFGAAPGSMAGVGAGSGRVHSVQWAPHVPHVLSACSLDRKVQVHNLLGAVRSAQRPPRKLLRPAGVSWGLGGRLVSFSAQPTGGVAAIHIAHVKQEPVAVQGARRLLGALRDNDLSAYCQAKAQDSLGNDDSTTWQHMRVLFEEDARKLLLKLLGFDADAVAAAQAHAQGQALPASTSSDPSPGGAGRLALALSSEGAAGSAEDFFGNSDTGAADEVHAEPSRGAPAPARAASGAPAAVDSDDSAPADDAERAAAAAAVQALRKARASDATVRTALLVGNFEAAVEACLSAGRVADALVLASCGGPELWAVTRSRCIDEEERTLARAAQSSNAISRSAFLRLVRGIVDDDLMHVVRTCPVDEWREALAIVSTFGKSDDFQALCNVLGERLLSEAGDAHTSAVLCFMCAVNIPRTLHLWEQEAATHVHTRGLLAALQLLVERVAVFQRSVGGDRPFDVDAIATVAPRFAQYATLLVEEGGIEEARAVAEMFAGHEDCQLLLHRLHNAMPSTPSPSRPTHATAAPAPAHAHAAAAAAAAASTTAHAPALGFGGAVSSSSTSSQGLSTYVPAQYGSSGFGGVGSASPLVADGFVSSHSQPELQAKYGNEPARYGTHLTTAMPLASGASGFAGADTYGSASAAGSGMYAPAEALASGAAPTPHIMNPYAQRAAAPAPAPGGASAGAGAGAAGSFAADAGVSAGSTAYGGAAAAAAAAAAPPAAEPDVLGDVPAECVPLTSALQQLIEQLPPHCTPVELKSLMAGKEGVDGLVHKLRAGKVAVAVQAQLQEMGTHITTYNFAAALEVHTLIADQYWRDHSDWLPKIKFVLAICRKKYQNA